MRHVVCLGNYLQGDDGFGIHVLALLRQGPVPDDVRLFDAGLAGLGALGFFEGCSEVIVVDALAYRGDEGRVHQLALEDAASPHHAFSAHEIDVHHLLHVLPIVFEGRTPPHVTIIGAEIRPPDGAFSMALSAPIQRATHAAAAAIRAALDRPREPTAVPGSSDLERDAPVQVGCQTGARPAP